MDVDRHCQLSRIRGGINYSFGVTTRCTSSSNKVAATWLKLSLAGNIFPMFYSPAAYAFLGDVSSSYRLLHRDNPFFLFNTSRGRRNCYLATELRPIISSVDERTLRAGLFLLQFFFNQSRNRIPQQMRLSLSMKFYFEATAMIHLITSTLYTVRRFMTRVIHFLFASLHAGEVGTALLKRSTSFC